jgi:hypothetical protein
MTIARALLLSALLAMASVPLMFLSVWFAIVYAVAWLAAMGLCWALVFRFFITPETWRTRLVIRKDDR